MWTVFSGSGLGPGRAFVNVLWTAFFWAVTPCGFLGGHYDLEDGGIMFLRNVGILVQCHDPERSPSDLRSEKRQRCEPSGCTWLLTGNLFTSGVSVTFTRSYLVNGLYYCCLCPSVRAWQIVVCRRRVWFNFKQFCCSHIPTQTWHKAVYFELTTMPICSCKPHYISAIKGHAYHRDLRTPHACVWGRLHCAF